jgi:acetyltransferase-like isoleucine patch superfamily enzyme
MFWISPRVTFLNSVATGEGAVVAAGAIVTEDIEPFTIVAGIPAKKIGNRNTNLKYEFSGNPGLFY